MPRLAHKPPKYGSSGQARVNYNVKVIHLGKYGSPGCGTHGDDQVDSPSSRFRIPSRLYLISEAFS
jgi:hypothetical protein